MSETAATEPVATPPVADAITEVKEEIATVQETKAPGWQEEIAALRKEIADLKTEAAKKPATSRVVQAPTPVVDKEPTPAKTTPADDPDKPDESPKRYGSTRWFGKD